jgi:NDP-sugar pyrophosphorylase family protein
MGENAEIGRGARIVAPAFIGQKAKIGDDCLITRGTDVECNSQVDFGTAAENSSILSNTYLGIGLDLSHSIVDGKYLWNLRHDVTLEITDPVVMRPNAVNTESRKWSEFENDAVGLSA